MTPPPALFPRPRHLERFDPAVRAPGAIDATIDPHLPPHGYRLIAGPDRTVLAHADDLGRRYGEQTVDQLRAGDTTLPSVEIRDWPDVARRGYMLDISRDRVPTRETLGALVDLLHRCRYDHLQLYVEHTVAYRGHEVVWRDASPLDADDLRWLDDRCAASGIELAANQNCFGHLERWLRHDPYRWRAECPDGFELLPGVHLPPAVVAPTDENAAFAVGLVREQMANLRTRAVNVGLDETFELGFGASQAACERRGRAAVYLEHLRRITEPLLADGCAVQCWGDVLGAHPELLAGLPAGDLTALPWTYEAPDSPVPALPDQVLDLLASVGIDLRADPSMAAHVAPFAEAGVPFWVAPGTSTWSSFVGRLENARANLLDAAETAVRSGAGGLLVTDWGDGGHHQPPSVSVAPIAYGGAVAWCGDTNRDLDLARVVDDLLGDPTGTIGGVLDRIGKVATRTGASGRNCSPLAAAVLPHQILLVTGEPDGDALAEIITDLDIAASDLHRARPAGSTGWAITEELAVAIGLARHGAERLAVRVGSSAADPASQRADLAGLIERYRAAWLARSRPGGLDDSAAHLERTLATYDAR